MRSGILSRLRRYSLIALVCAGGCQEAPKLPNLPTLTPYKMDIQQGNYVTQEMVAKLKPGMTPAQVRFILGTPLVVDAFHKDRWDYVYRYSKAGKLQEARRIVVVFRDDKLLRIEGDVIAGQPGGATDGGARVEQVVPGQAGPPAAAPGAAKPVPEPAAATAPGQGRDAGAGGSPAPPAAEAAAPGEPAPPASEKAKEEKPGEERGLFGRMLERLGF